jgi:hypothetical protein
MFTIARAKNRGNAIRSGNRSRHATATNTASATTFCAPRNSQRRREPPIAAASALITTTATSGRCVSVTVRNASETFGRVPAPERGIADPLQLLGRDVPGSS